MAVAKKLNPIRLNWNQKNRQVMVTDQDEDRYTVLVEHVIEACRFYEPEKRALFRQQFEKLQDFLGSWSSERKTKLQKAIITLRDAGMLFLVVTNRKTFDENFESQLTELDLNVANNDDFSEINLSVQSLPYCDEDNYYSFCNPEWMLEYKGLNAN